jgi:anti-anti-sigma factor
VELFHRAFIFAPYSEWLGEAGVMSEILLERVSGWPLLRVRGPLTLGSEADSFAVAVKDLLAQEERHILCHLGDVERIDSSGIAALIAVREAVASASGRLVLVSPSARVQSILETMRLFPLFEIANDKDAAARALAAPVRRASPTNPKVRPGQ